MLVLINTNRMTPPIAPLGLEYVAGAARRAGIDVDLLDLCLADDPDTALRQYFAAKSPRLVGLTFRNVDDCFWPSGRSFVSDLCETVRKLRGFTDAPLLLGGVGFSMFPERLLDETRADFGVHGDGEEAIVSLTKELDGRRNFAKVPGLLWRRDGRTFRNPPAWPRTFSLPTSRDVLDNKTYFRRGGQLGLETARGCDRRCVYCADPLAKGPRVRLRSPVEVADEVEALLARDLDVLHLADSEFNAAQEHALAVCEMFTRRSFQTRLRWYTYMAVLPFDVELAAAMAQAGCVGINFTADSASPAMLKTYRQPHTPEDLANAVRLARDHGISVMLDLLLGGPGETPETLKATVDFIKRIGPDAVGAQLGVRVYPHTALADLVAVQGPLDANPSLRRRYSGPVDLFRPTFYISSALGDRPAKLVRELVGGDLRFFEPVDEGDRRDGDAASDYNYNDNTPLVDAIAAGARGAYWDILRKLRSP